MTYRYIDCFPHEFSMVIIKMSIAPSLDLLISIHPKYVKEIRSGNKKYEFRKSIFKKPVRNIYIYETQPVKKIAGYFPYMGYYKGMPSFIWKTCAQFAGIDEQAFFDYFSKAEIAYAIKIDDFLEFSPSIDPRMIWNHFVAPQSYRYLPLGCLDDEKLCGMVQAKRQE